MNDNLSEIPARAYINAQIIEQAELIGAFDEPTRQVENMWNLKEDSLKKLGVVNSAYLAGLLYCLFVVPQELWVQNEQHPIFNKIDKGKLLDLIKVDSASKQSHKSVGIVHNKPLQRDAAARRS